MEGESVWSCFQDIAKFSLFPPQKYKNLFIFAVCLIIKFSKSMKSTFLQEFKDFAVKGNAIDMAVGVIIGGAFGKIVSSIVNDLIMPPIGWLIGGIDFKDLKYQLPVNPLDEGVEPVCIAYGNFLQTCLDFLIIAFCVFLLVRLIMKLSRKKKEEPKPAAPVEPSEEVKLLREIRDALKKG